MRGWRPFAGTLSCAIASLLVTPAQAAQPVAILQPSSAWIVNYKDHSCALQRAFGDEQHRVFMELDDFTLHNEFRATVSSSSFGVTFAKAIVGFEPGTPVAAKGLVKAAFNGGRRGVIFDLFLDSAFDTEQDSSDSVQSGPSDEAEKQREKIVTGLFVGGSFRENLVLKTGPLAAPMDALRTCDEDLERHIGLDPQAIKSIASPAKPKDEGHWAWLIQDSYPEAALRADATADVRFRLVVDATGKVNDCYARPEGQLDVFGETACTLLKSKAVFDPARDANGNAVPSVYILRIVWALS